MPPRTQSDQTDPQNCAVQQKLSIAFTTQDWGFDHVGLGASQGQQCLTNFFDCRRLHRRVAHNAALPYLLAAGFELRLYQNNDLPAHALEAAPGKAAAITAGRTRVAEMKETSITTRSTASPTCCG